MLSVAVVPLRLQIRAFENEFIHVNSHHLPEIERKLQHNFLSSPLCHNGFLEPSFMLINQEIHEQFMQFLRHITFYLSTGVSSMLEFVMCSFSA